MDGGIIKTECDKEDRIVYAYEVWMGEVYLEVKDEEGNTYYEHCMKETAGEVAKYEGCITFSNEQPQVFYVHSYVISEEAVVGGHIQGEEMCNNFDVFIRKLRLYLLGF